MNSRKITPEERDELRDAILTGKITNATAFAEAYAIEHGLNPSTVRTTISRLRHEVGALERGPRAASGGISARGSGRAGWFARMLTAADPVEVAEIGAAALVRYEAEPEFKSAVNERKPEVARLYKTLQELRDQLANRPERVRQELIYAFLESGAD